MHETTTTSFRWSILHIPPIPFHPPDTRAYAPLLELVEGGGHLLRQQHVRGVAPGAPPHGGGPDACWDDGGGWWCVCVCHCVLWFWSLGEGKGREGVGGACVHVFVGMGVRFSPCVSTRAVKPRRGTEPLTDSCCACFCDLGRGVWVWLMDGGGPVSQSREMCVSMHGRESVWLVGWLVYPPRRPWCRGRWRGRTSSPPAARRRRGLRSGGTVVVLMCKREEEEGQNHLRERGEGGRWVHPHIHVHVLVYTHRRHARAPTHAALELGDHELLPVRAAALLLQQPLGCGSAWDVSAFGVCWVGRWVGLGWGCAHITQTAPKV